MELIFYKPSPGTDFFFQCLLFGTDFFLWYSGLRMEALTASTVQVKCKYPFLKQITSRFNFSAMKNNFSMSDLDPSPLEKRDVHIKEFFHRFLFPPKPEISGKKNLNIFLNIGTIHAARHLDNGAKVQMAGQQHCRAIF